MHLDDFGFVSQNPLAPGLPAEWVRFVKRAKAARMPRKTKSNQLIRNDFHKNGFVISNVPSQKKPATLEKTVPRVNLKELKSTQDKKPNHAV